MFKCTGVYLLTMKAQLLRNRMVGGFVVKLCTAVATELHVVGSWLCTKLTSLLQLNKRGCDLYLNLVSDYGGRDQVNVALCQFTWKLCYGLKCTC